MGSAAGRKRLCHLLQFHIFLGYLCITLTLWSRNCSLGPGYRSKGALIFFHVEPNIQGSKMCHERSTAGTRA